MKTSYLITEYRRDLKQQWYVAARPGWMRKANGQMARDGSFQGGPEWTTKREHALVFDTHRKAARVLTKCPSAKISTLIPDYSKLYQVTDFADDQLE